jgi:hypothetical protein
MPGRLFISEPLHSRCLRAHGGLRPRDDQRDSPQHRDRGHRQPQRDRLGQQHDTADGGDDRHAELHRRRAGRLESVQGGIPDRVADTGSQRARCTAPLCARLPDCGIAPRMEYGQDHDLLGLDNVENGVGKAARPDTPDFLVHD